MFCLLYCNILVLYAQGFRFLNILILSTLKSFKMGDYFVNILQKQIIHATIAMNKGYLLLKILEKNLRYLHI